MSHNFVMEVLQLICIFLFLCNCIYHQKLQKDNYKNLKNSRFRKEKVCKSPFLVQINSMLKTPQDSQLCHRALCVMPAIKCLESWEQIHLTKHEVIFCYSFLSDSSSWEHHYLASDHLTLSASCLHFNKKEANNTPEICSN